MTLASLNLSAASTVKEHGLQKDRISPLPAHLHKYILGYTDLISFTYLTKVSRTFNKYNYNDWFNQTGITTLKTLRVYFRKILKKDVNRFELFQELNKFFKENATFLKNFDLSWSDSFFEPEWKAFNFFHLFTQTFPSSSYPHLKTLTIEGFSVTGLFRSTLVHKICDGHNPTKMVSELAQACPNLTDLKVRDFTLDVLKEFVLQCKNLTRLEIIGRQFDEELVRLLNSNQQLTAVSLYVNEFNHEELIPLLPNIKNLTSLRIRNVPNLLEPLKKCARLQKLALEIVRITSGELIQTLSCLKELVHLKIASCLCTSKFFSVLPTLPKFQALTLEGWFETSPLNFYISYSLVPSRKPSEMFNVNDIDHLAKCPSLEKIEITECEGLYDEHIKKLQAIPLKKLIINIVQA